MPRLHSARSLVRSLLTRPARPPRPPAPRLGVLALEDRVVPQATDIAGLRFEVPGTFTQSPVAGGTQYNSAGSIAVGLVPQGGPFVPLLRLADGGSVTDLGNGTSPFTWVNRVTAVTSGAPLTLFAGKADSQTVADTLPGATTAVPHAGGQSVPVGPFGLTPTAFRVRSAGQLGVGGDLGVADFGGLTLPAGADKFVTAPADPGVSFSAATVEGGFRLGANPSFGVAGLSFQPQPNPALPTVGGYVRVTQGTNRVEVAGQAQFALAGNPVAVTIGQYDPANPAKFVPGVAFEGGALKSLDVAFTSAVKLGGLTFTADGLRGTYDAAGPKFTVAGKTGFDLKGSAVGVTLGGGATPGLVVVGGAVTSAGFTVDSTVKLGGLTFTAKGLTATYDNAASTYTIRGGASLDLKGSAVEVGFGDKSTAGLVIAGGKVTSADFAVNADLRLGGLTFTSKDLRGTYTDATETYTLKGAATFALASTDGAVAVTFGGATTPGLVIVSGTVRSADFTVDSTITVGGLTFTSQGLRATYADAGLGTYTLAGKATFDLAGSTVAVTAGDKTTAGLVVVGGSVQSFDFTVDSTITVGGVTFTSQGLRATYAAADRKYTLSGAATATVAGLGTLNLTFGFPSKPGLVIQNGSLVSLDTTLNSDITVSAVKVTTTGLNLSYAAATGLYTLTGAAGATVPGVGYLGLLFGFQGKPGLVLSNGALTLLDLTLTSDLTVSGVKITTTGLELTYTAADSRFALTGAATAAVNNLGTVGLTFGSAGKPGLVIQNGALDSLAITLASDLTVSGVRIATTGLALAYTAKDGLFTLAGTAGVTVAGLGTVSATFGSPGKPGLVIQNGALVSLNTTLASGITVSGVAIATTGLEFSYTAASGLFTIAGSASATIDKLGTVDLLFGNGGRPGLVVANGALVSLDLTLNSDITVSAVKVTTTGLNLTYAAASSQFTLTGAAKATIDKIGTVDVTFGYAGKPGLVIQNGSLAFLDLTLNADITVSAVKITTTGLELTYTAATSQFTLTGTATATIDKLGTVGVTFGFLGKPGLVIQNGALSSLDLTLNSDFSIAGARITTTGLELTYRAENSRFTLTGAAMVSVPQLGNISVMFGYTPPQPSKTELNALQFVGEDTYYAAILTGATGHQVAVRRFNSQERFDIQKLADQSSPALVASAVAAMRAVVAAAISRASDPRPGLVIENGSLVSIDLRVNSNFTFLKYTFSVQDLDLSYTAATSTFTIRGKASVDLLLGNFSIQLGDGAGGQGLVLVNGKVQSIDATVSGEVGVSFASFGNATLNLKYNGDNGQFDITGRINLELKIKFPFPISVFVKDTGFRIAGVDVFVRIIPGDNANSFVQVGTKFADVPVTLKVTFSGDVSTDPSIKVLATQILNEKLGFVGKGVAAVLRAVGILDNEVAGATIFYDANKNGLLDPGEPSAVSGADGTVSPLQIPAGGDGQLVVFGGTNVGTGLPNRLILTAPLGATKVTPLSTLAQAFLAGHDGLTDADVRVEVRNAFGLPDGVDILNDDVIKAALGGSRNAALTFAADVQVATVAKGIAALLGDQAADGSAVFATLADMIYSTTGQVNLADPAVITQLTQDTATRLGVTLDPALVSGGAAVIAGIIARIKAIPAPDGSAFVRELDQIQKAANIDAFRMLAAAAAGTMDIAAAVAAQTGDAFAAEVAAEQVGVLAAPASNASPLYAVGTGVGGGPRVKVYDRQTNALVADFFAFDPAFRGGVSVAVGDVTGDGVPDVVVAAGAGGHARVIVIDGTKLNKLGADGQIDPSALVASFFGFNVEFTGGATVALARLDSGPGLDLLIGAGAGGGPRVRTFKWNPTATGGVDQLPGRVGDFFALDPAFTGGVNVAAADLDGLGRDDLIVGAGVGGGPVVAVYLPDGTLRDTFMAYDPSSRGGVSVAGGYLDGTATAQLVTASGPGGPAVVNVYQGADLTLERSAPVFGSDFTGGASVSVGPTADGQVRVAVGAGPGGGPRVGVLSADGLQGVNDFFGFDPAFHGGVSVG